MACIDWVDDYIVGVNLVDEQHRDLVVSINKLHQIATESPPDTIKISDSLFELLEHTMNHFIAEEELLQRLEYPELAEYKQHNDAFNVKAQGIIQQLGAEPTLSESTFEYLKQWISGHILAKDKAYATFLIEHGIN